MRRITDLIAIDIYLSKVLESFKSFTKMPLTRRQRILLAEGKRKAAGNQVVNDIKKRKIVEEISTSKSKSRRIESTSKKQNSEKNVSVSSTCLKNLIECFAPVSKKIFNYLGTFHKIRLKISRFRAARTFQNMVRTTKVL